MSPKAENVRLITSKVAQSDPSGAGCLTRMVRKISNGHVLSNFVLKHLLRNILLRFLSVACTSKCQKSSL